MCASRERSGPTAGQRDGWRWGRLYRGVLRYTVVYAGGAVVATALVLDSHLALVGLVGLGSLLLLLATGGEGGVRTRVPGTHEDRLFEAGTRYSDSTPAGVSRTAKYVLLGTGLVVGGVLALVLA